jgi:uncharacterized membrane protein YoaK (UPF0700 family)
MSRKSVRREREKAWLAVLLAWVAGSVDAIGFLALVHLFTAHMSGNTVGMGAYLGHGQWREAVRRGSPIPFFVCGVVFGAAVATFAARRGLRPFFAPVLALETALLLAYLAWSGHVLRERGLQMAPAGLSMLMVALPAIAMGLQSATVRRVGALTVRTTFITGVLTEFGEAVAESAAWAAGQWRKGRQRRAIRVARRRLPVVRAMLLAALWCAYALGAIAGGFGVARGGMGALWMPVAVLAAVIVADIVSPIEPYPPA